MEDVISPFDMNNYPEAAPDCIIIGRHVGWRLNRNYSDAQFGLKYVIRQVGSDTEVEVVGTRLELDDEIEYWVFEATSSLTTAWVEFTDDANCRWDLVMTELSSENSAVLQSGFIRVFQSVSDRRSHAEIMLSKINSIIEGRADSDVDSYSIKSRSISRMSVKDLMMWRDYYINEIERTGGTVDEGGGAPSKPDRNTVRIRFVN